MDSGMDRSKAVKDLISGLFGIAAGSALLMYTDVIPTPRFVTNAIERLQTPDALQAAKPMMPTKQINFVKAIEEARTTYNSAANDMAKGAARQERKSNLCEQDTGNQIDGWIGTIHGLSSNSDGLGVLSVKISPNVTVGTWNNSLSDLGFRTLLKPTDPVHSHSVNMKTGTRVRFSGILFQRPTDCFAETSLTLHGSMTSPKFIVRFKEISPF